mmetsp:Transcript_55426/g.117834  ORF Transcript_55426/g.117834 Transcript_55426/m.117834 type:complete len:211 (-) Transcript_55426:104-736(-)
MALSWELDDDSSAFLLSKTSLSSLGLSFLCFLCSASLSSPSPPLRGEEERSEWSLSTSMASSWEPTGLCRSFLGQCPPMVSPRLLELCFDDLFLFSPDEGPLSSCSIGSQSLLLLPSAKVRLPVLCSEALPSAAPPHLFCLRLCRLESMFALPYCFLDVACPPPFMLLLATRWSIMLPVALVTSSFFPLLIVELFTTCPLTTLPWDTWVV